MSVAMGMLVLCRLLCLQTLLKLYHPRCSCMKRLEEFGWVLTIKAVKLC